MPQIGPEEVSQIFRNHHVDLIHVDLSHNVSVLVRGSGASRPGSSNVGQAWDLPQPSCEVSR